MKLRGHSLIPLQLASNRPKVNGFTITPSSMSMGWQCVHSLGAQTSQPQTNPKTFREDKQIDQQNEHPGSSMRFVLHCFALKRAGRVFFL